MSKLILEHLKYSRQSLIDYCNNISLASHKGNLGSAREALIINFLANNLPRAINYETGEYLIMIKEEVVR